MASNNFVYVKLSWETCPPELLRIIFKKLDYRSLINCMTVNKRWKTAAGDFIEFFELWPNIVSEVLINEGYTLRNKSRLPAKDILINSMLWSSVSSARVEHLGTCKVLYIKNMQMYRDILIVKANKHILYFNLNLDIIRHYKSAEEDLHCTESDFIHAAANERIIRTHMCTTRVYSNLNLYGKSNPNDRGVRYKCTNGLGDILMYSLDGNVCYIVASNNKVWAFIWDVEVRKWFRRSLGRYYGSDTIHAIHVSNNIVSMVTMYGKVLCENPQLMNFTVAVNHNSSTASNWVLFRRSDVAVSVPEAADRKRINLVMKSNHMKLECAGMSCATEHGDILFLGFKDGVVAICRPDNMRVDHCEPELTLNIADYVELIEDPTVLAIEIFEDKRSHHLFIGVKHHIVHLILTYPLNITTNYD